MEDTFIVSLGMKSSSLETAFVLLVCPVEKLRILEGFIYLSRPELLFAHILFPLISLLKLDL